MARTKRVRVLVAEDEWLVRLLTVGVLRDLGLEVLAAENGSEAIGLLYHPDHVDLVITDLIMPGADGVTLARKARAKHPGIPLLFLTATPSMLDGQSDLEPYRCLPKPYNPTAIIKAIKDMLQSGLGAS